MNRHKSVGFTLIELLVVIAIISILAAILFPVFATAREKARQSSCLSNLKQMGIAITQYEQDFDECVPPANFYSAATSYRSNWVYTIYPYIKSQGVFQCPCDSSTTPVNGTSYWPANPAFPITPHISYLYNYHLTLSTADGNNTHYGSQISQFVRPAATVVIVDGAAQPPVGVSDPTLWPAKPTAWMLFDIVANTPSWTQGLDPGNLVNDAIFAAPFARHQGLCNVLWADGHTKTLGIDRFYNTTGATQYGTTNSSCLNFTTACSNAQYQGG